jgi:hypothetical protein
MTTFKEIRGTDILALSSDPSNPEIGQIWYNSSSGTLKGRVALTAGWSAGGNMNTARSKFANGAGTQTSALGAGGYNSGSAPYNSSAVETYNGTSWTSVASLASQVRGNAVTGASDSSALSFAGVQGPATFTAQTESWNGSSWTTVNSMNTGRSQVGRFGIQSAALAFGGYVSPPGWRNNTESWNGTSWTTSPAVLNTARSVAGSAGTQSAGIFFGGNNGSNTAATESWNGSSWTTVNSMNTTRNGLAGFGTQTAAIGAGGSTGSGATESWNGTSWTNTTSMSTQRNEVGGAGTQTTGLAFGGIQPGFFSATEEWTGPGSFGTKTITVS